MVFRRFKINCIVRVLLLAATVYIFFYLLIRSSASLHATTFILGILSIYQVYSLMQYVQKTNRDLTRFLESIRYSDFSQAFSSHGVGSSFEELSSAFGEVIQEFRQTRAEKEEHFRYLQTVVQHVGIGLIAFQKSGEIELMNNAAKKLLKIGYAGAPSLVKNVKALEFFSKPLVRTLLQLRPGEKALVKVNDMGELLQLAVSATDFKLRGQHYTLVSLQNIHSELEEKEMEAWQNLIRVLTHEIMNSVTPIASLASTVNQLIANSHNVGDSSDSAGDDMIKDIRGGIQTIEKRSHGLLHFVDAYRNLTRVPRPNLQLFPVSELFGRARQLLALQTSEKEIELAVSVQPDGLELTADPELVEQVLINLLLNAMQAVDGRPNAKVDLAARIDPRGRVLIQVGDNGPGIPEDVQERIFIPFFTTKEDGSGIGLSLSRQIMRLHKGSITVHSTPDVETVFTLRF